MEEAAFSQPGTDPRTSAPRLRSGQAIRGETRNPGDAAAHLIFKYITTLLRLSKELSVLVSLLWPWYSARMW